MPGVSTVDEIVHEDLSDMYINLDVTQTKFTSRLKEGEQISNVDLFSYGIEKYDGRLVVGIPEGVDVETFETDKQVKASQRTQKFWRRPHVTVESNEVNKTVADFGKYRKQVIKKTTEQKRDVEMKSLSDSDSVPGDGATIGREFMAAGRWFNDGVSVGTSGAALTWGDAQTSPLLTIPDYLTPTAQIYTGTLYSQDVSGNQRLDFDDEAWLNMLQNRFDLLGETKQLSGFVDGVLKRHLSRLSRYQKNMVGFTPTSRTMQESIAAQTYLMFGADLWETDFGPVDINLISWLPRTTAGAMSGRGYFFDMEFIFMRKSGVWLRHTEFEDKGGGPRGLIQSIMAPSWGSPQGALKIDPATVVGSF